MILIPAIDIRGGNCVRLFKGEFDKEEIFSENPAEMAAKWARAGAEFLHIVDLDGARAGRIVNSDAIKNIIAAAKIPAELGGGIRTAEDIDSAFELGISRVIIGSAAVKNPSLVLDAVKKYGDKIAVGVDARDGIVQIAGWEESGGVSAVKLAKDMVSLGVKTIIHTDVSRDGTLAGANVSASAELAGESGADVIVSGGVSSLSDIKNIKKYEGKGITGIIAGKALYTGALDLAEALDILRAEV